jgi:hypothetical protein
VLLTVIVCAGGDLPISTAKKARLDGVTFATATEPADCANEGECSKKTPDMSANTRLH